MANSLRDQDARGNSPLKAKSQRQKTDFIGKAMKFERQKTDFIGKAMKFERQKTDFIEKAMNFENRSHETAR